MQTESGALAARMLNKVPAVTLAFWAVKIMATTVGETAADFLSANLGLGLGGTSAAMAVLLVVVLALQLRSRRYVPATYWLTVVLVSVAGTLITDNLTDQLGIPLVVTTSLFAATLAVVFFTWYVNEGTLSVHHVDSTPREAFYWAAILVTFALGTAAGDWVAESLRLGYAISVGVFGALIAVVALAHFRFGMNATLAFWIAYVLTRPFGASLGDLLAQPAGNGGLGMGTVGTSVVFLATIVTLVGAMTAAQRRALRAVPVTVDGDRA
jgi:uncharacterized membrane-anchored protein